MIDLPNAQEHSGGAHPSLQPLPARLAAPNRPRAPQVPQMQNQVLEPAAGAQDQAQPAGQSPWITRGSNSRFFPTPPETRRL
jgi:hypothetical protein